MLWKISVVRYGKFINERPVDMFGKRTVTVYHSNDRSTREETGGKGTEKDINSGRIVWKGTICARPYQRLLFYMSKAPAKTYPKQLREDSQESVTKAR